MEGAKMFKFISVALVTLMVSTTAVPAFAKGDKAHHGSGKGGGAHHMGGLGGKGFGKGLGIAAAAAVFGMALEELSQ
jgi:hypothetical protein